MHALSTECGSRQGIKKKKNESLFRVTFSSQHSSSRLSTTRFSINRYVCFSPMPSTTSIYSLASRSWQSVILTDRCNDTKLEHRSSLCFPPFQHDFKSAPKSKTGMCSSHDSDCTSLEYPTMVPRTLKNSDKPKKYCPPINGGGLIDTSGLVGFRKTLFCEGISENFSHVFTRYTL